ncbi:Clp protease N-terminal domain-containing protein [Streptomyces chiangmaiensis]
MVTTTPQLLAVIATNPGSRGRRVLNDLGIDVADIKRLLHCYINIPRTAFGRRTRRGRPGKKQPDRCSFCGHARSETRRLVAAPTCGSAPTASPDAAKSSPTRPPPPDSCRGYGSEDP